MISFFTRRLHVIGILRKGYRNWVGIVIAYLLARDRPVSLQTLDGRSVEGVMIKDISNAIALPTLLRRGWEIRPADTTHALLVSQEGVSIKCRLDAGADIAHIATIFVEEAYETDLQDRIVIDVGASNGDSALYFAHKGARRVVALEPSQASFKLAVENVNANNEGKRITILNAALSVKSGRQDLHTSSRSPNADTLVLTELTRRINVFDGNQVVETVSLGDLLAREKLQYVDLLKLDCEGSEYELVRSLAVDVIGKIGEIMLEYHEGPMDLPDALGRKGFDVKSSEGAPLLGYLRARRRE